MEGSRDNLATVPLMTARRLFQHEPFVFVDVGCSGGIPPVWRQFGEDLVAFGFDPQRSECRRLQERETNPRIEYIASFVGLPPNHPFVRRRAAEDPRIFQHFNPWDRLSTAAALRAETSAAPQAQPILEDEVSLADIIGVSEFIAQRNVSNVDFIKIDVDGTDLDVVVSCEDIAKSHGVLGFAIEVNWTGSHLDTDNTFHNIDRQMRRLGYSLVSVTQRTYSREHLPAPFLMDILAQTRWGQPIQGDAIYLRDAASEHDRVIWGSDLSPAKLLKLVALYDIFSLPDLAAELLVKRRQELARVIDVDLLLDALAPPLHGRRVSYASYVEAFRRDPTSFLKSNWRDIPDDVPPITVMAPEPTPPTQAEPVALEGDLAGLAQRVSELEARVDALSALPHLTGYVPWQEDLRRLAKRGLRFAKRKLTG